MVWARFDRINPFVPSSYVTGLVSHASREEIKVKQRRGGGLFRNLVALFWSTLGRDWPFVDGRLDWLWLIAAFGIIRRRSGGYK